MLFLLPTQQYEALLFDLSTFLFSKLKLNSYQNHLKGALFNLYPLAILLQVGEHLVFVHGYNSDRSALHFVFSHIPPYPPFSKCTYCNFNKYIDPNVDNDRMEKSLVTELRTELAHWGLDQKSRPIRSVYFGGKRICSFQGVFSSAGKNFL